MAESTSAAPRRRGKKSPPTNGWRGTLRSSAATFAERKLAVGHFAKVISSAARVAERGLTLDGRCLKIRPLMVRGAGQTPEKRNQSKLGDGQGFEEK